MVMSTMMTSLAEGMTLSAALGLENDALIEVYARNIKHEIFFLGGGGRGGEGVVARRVVEPNGKSG